MRKNLALLLGSLVALLLLLEGGWRVFYFLKNHSGKTGAGFELYALGESTVRGFGDESFADILAKAYSDSFRPGKLFYNNMARTGYTSYPHWLSLRQAVAFRPQAAPAALLIYTGHNEALNTGTPSRFEKFWLDHIERKVDKSFFLSEMLYHLRRVGVFRMDGSYQWYELNLRRIIDTARANGIQAFLSTLAVNYSGVEPSIDARDEPAIDRIMEQGARLESGKRYAEAAAFYVESAAHDAAHRALWFFRAARVRERMHDYASARALYREAVNNDARLTYKRANCIQNELVRSVARELAVNLVDVAEAFEKASPNAVPGNNLFGDACHPNTAGVALLVSVFPPAMEKHFHVNPAFTARSADDIHRLLPDARQNETFARATYFDMLFRNYFLHKRWAQANRELAVAHWKRIRELSPDSVQTHFCEFILDISSAMDPVLGCHSGVYIAPTEYNLDDKHAYQSLADYLWPAVKRGMVRPGEACPDSL